MLDVKLISYTCLRLTYLTHSNFCFKPIGSYMISEIPSIHIKNARLEYNQRVIFENLDFQIPAAQFTCICGPSGVGKSSLLRLIAGLLTYANVSSQIQSSDNKPLTGRIAYMAQPDLLVPWRTVLAPQPPAKCSAFALEPTVRVSLSAQRAA